MNFKNQFTFIILAFLIIFSIFGHFDQFRSFFYKFESRTRNKADFHKNSIESGSIFNKNVVIFNFELLKLGLYEKIIYWKFNSSISKSKRTFFFRTSCIEILWTDIRYHKLSLLEIPSFFLVFGDEIRDVPEEIQESGVIVVVRWEDQLAKAAFSGWNQIPRSNGPTKAPSNRQWWPRMTFSLKMNWEEYLKNVPRCRAVNHVYNRGQIIHEIKPV